MEPQYPLFVLEKDDNSVRMVSNEQDFSWYEAIDIEDGEYVGWDVVGRPLELYTEQERIKVRLASPEPQREKLRETILEYAQLSRPATSFVFSGPPDDLIALFQAVEEHIQGGRPKKFLQVLREKLWKSRRRSKS